MRVPGWTYGPPTHIILPLAFLPHWHYVRTRVYSLSLSLSTEIPTRQDQAPPPPTTPAVPSPPMRPLVPINPWRSCTRISYWVVTRAIPGPHSNLFLVRLECFYRRNSGLVHGYATSTQPLSSSVGYLILTTFSGTPRRAAQADRNVERLGQSGPS